MTAPLQNLPFDVTICTDATVLQKQKELERQWAAQRRAVHTNTARMIEGHVKPTDLTPAKYVIHRNLHLKPSEAPFRLRLAVTTSAASPELLKPRLEQVRDAFSEMSGAVGVVEQFGVDRLVRSTWPFSPTTDINSRQAITSEVAALTPAGEG